MEVFERLIEKMAELEKTSEHKAYYYRVSDSLTIMICGMLSSLQNISDIYDGKSLNADINAADNKGCTALMRAAYSGYPELVKFLLENGADKSKTDYDGNMAIHYVRKECLADLKDILK